MELYRPPDVEEANQLWGANCGPAALAAITGRALAQVRAHLPDFESRGYCNPTQIKQALESMEIQFARTSTGRDWPSRGLLFVQWCGPWTNPGAPTIAAYRHTHWIATDGNGGGVYDVNHESGWISRQDWENALAPWIMKSIPRCNQNWFIRWSCEIPPAKVISQSTGK